MREACRSPQPLIPVAYQLGRHLYFRRGIVLRMWRLPPRTWRPGHCNVGPRLHPELDISTMTDGEWGGACQPTTNAGAIAVWHFGGVRRRGIVRRGHGAARHSASANRGTN